MAKYDCLIVDDEEALSRSTCEYLNMFGVNTCWAADEEACFAFFDRHEADLLLLDINLGQGSSGFEICRRLRAETNIPILFISARTSDDDVLLALNVGGDDYIQKPYALSIILAKVKTVLKRYRGDADAASFGCFRLDRVTEKLTNNGQEIKLKAMEYKLLSYLLQNRNRPLSKEELFTNVWNDAITGDGTLNVHIRRLREKIEASPNEPQFIKTLWGTGYIFEAE
ncbi:response regulator transcription factor [Paenibacillus sp. MMS20-IR301]|uniref:response regulator transcription factor n=1 Tax=Paenibacillus sp. MMS20-IR301 TaxID=2895946 RepID=UPI0028E1F951|nr:response regulator transcription factor [Paenibacillus sp. MMS20-IR301]WNS40727.1 response regulator transcription factor [Paenibacillus sp. MMS20-IR301]